MAKRNDSGVRPKEGAADASGSTAATTMEQRVMAFAEQLGRIAGTVQAAAEGFMDREGVKTQIAAVRDGAADLLDHLAAGAKAARTKPGVQTKPDVQKVAAVASKGRSGGVVDAPGKRHRKRMPSDPGAGIADSQAAKLRAAKTMVKTKRLRGRG